MYSMICRDTRNYLRVADQPDDATAPGEDSADTVSFYFVEGRRATKALVKFLRSRYLYRSELIANVCVVDREDITQLPFTTYAPGPYMAHNIISWNWVFE